MEGNAARYGELDAIAEVVAALRRRGYGHVSQAELIELAEVYARVQATLAACRERLDPATQPAVIFGFRGPDPFPHEEAND